eukprot:2058964-Pleurochrysis_carterae.AAC.4
MATAMATAMATVTATVTVTVTAAMRHRAVMGTAGSRPVTNENRRPFDVLVERHQCKYMGCADEAVVEGIPVGSDAAAMTETVKNADEVKRWLGSRKLTVLLTATDATSEDGMLGSKMPFDKF